MMYHVRMRRIFLLLVCAACAGKTPNSFDGGNTDDAGDEAGDLDGSLNSDGNTMMDVATDNGPPPEPIVYGHSPTTLYKLDPKTKAITTIGNFDCASDVIDLAIDKNNNAFITSFGGVYTLNLMNAKCVVIAMGSYPNSLSFVPKGTLDQNAEALVGYFGSQYVRIDTKTGAITMVGAISGGYASSGDIVSVINGPTYLTVNGPGCTTDCLIQVDPKTGNLIKNWGPTGYSAVWGIAYWGGAV